MDEAGARFPFRGHAHAPSSLEGLHPTKVETDEGGMTEAGWLNFGFENYYTLLNCGFRLQPTAGTASGVHPVPLGYSRVYVHLDKEFSGDAWIDGLKKGRSFVTTGPMLFTTVNGHHPGHVFEHAEKKVRYYRLTGESLSARPLDRLEIVVNGKVRSTVKVQNRKTAEGAFSTKLDLQIPIGESSWLVVRSFEKQPGGRERFAHTAPWHIEVAGAPVRPRREEVDFVIRRIRDEIVRNEKVLPAAAMEEYREALEIYREIGKRAR